MSVPRHMLEQALADLDSLYKTRLESSRLRDRAARATNESIPGGGSLEIVTELAAKYSDQLIYQAIIQGISAVFYVVDDRLRLVGWNRRFEEVVKRTSDELRGMVCLELVSPTAWPETMAVIKRAVAGPPFAFAESVLAVSDGTCIPYLVSANVVSMGDHWYIFGFGIDISSLKEAEHTSERYAALEHLLARTAGDLLSMVGGSEEDQLNRAVEPIARFMGMDFFEIYTFDFTDNTICGRAGWRRDDDRAEPHLLDGLPVSAFPYVYGLPDLTELFIVEDIMKLDGDFVSLREIFEPHGIRALAVVPMAVADAAVGFLIFGVSSPHAIDPGHHVSLKMMGQFIANVLLRLDKDRNLAAREAELQATLAATYDGVLVVDTSGRLIRTAARYLGSSRRRKNREPAAGESIRIDYPESRRQRPPLHHAGGGDPPLVGRPANGGATASFRAGGSKRGTRLYLQGCDL